MSNTFNDSSSKQDITSTRVSLQFMISVERPNMFPIRSQDLEETNIKQSVQRNME